MPARQFPFFATLCDCLAPLYESGYVHYFAYQDTALHVAILPRESTFAKPGAVYLADEEEVDRLIWSCGTLSFLQYSRKITVYSQKRTGIVCLHKSRLGSPLKRSDLMRFLWKHTKLPHFDV